MPYYVMTCYGEYPAAGIEDEPWLGDSWIDGQRIEVTVPSPLKYTLNADRPGNLKYMYDACDCPLMHEDLIEALRAAGVDNIEFFDAEILNQETGEKHINYKAFNIIGVLAAADMSKSKVASADSEIIDVFFESLSLDESLAHGMRMFRLAESVSAIIVDEKVKNEVEKRGIPGMVFFEPEDWSG